MAHCVNTDLTYWLHRSVAHILRNPGQSNWIESLISLTRFYFSFRLDIVVTQIHLSTQIFSQRHTKFKSKWQIENVIWFFRKTIFIPNGFLFLTVLFSHSYFVFISLSFIFLLFSLFFFDLDRISKEFEMTTWRRVGSSNQFHDD